MQKQQPQTANWWNNATQWMKKKYFNISHTLDLTLNNDKSPEVWLMGQKFNNEDAKAIYSSILWFTYRDDLKFPKSSVTSDVGWGCMLRVVQMMLAQTFRFHKGIQYFSDETTINNTIKLFIGQNQPYCVQKLYQMGKKLYAKQVGDWYSPCEVAYIIKQIENNRNTDLKVMVCDSQLQFSSVFSFLRKSHDKKSQILSSSQLKKNKATIKTNLEEEQSIDPGLIIILIRIGLNQPNPDHLASIIKILKEQVNCVGILGGRPGRAHYIVGTTEKSFIYLDPHTVRTNSDIDNYFCQNNIFSLPHQKIDPSMGLCFYIRNFAQLITISDKFQQYKKMMAFYSYSIIQKPKIIEIEEQDRVELMDDDFQPIEQL